MHARRLKNENYFQTLKDRSKSCLRRFIIAKIIIKGTDKNVKKGFKPHLKNIQIKNIFTLYIHFFALIYNFIQPLKNYYKQTINFSY